MAYTKNDGVLYNVGTNTINYHLHKLYEDGEIEEDSVIRKFRITANDGKEYNTLHYNLKAISQLIVPPIDLQKQFMTFVKQVDKSKVAVQKSLDETQKLFDSLMKEYFG